jgi:hypothetical protein
MADNYTPTVVQQTILEADMTPLERMLLSCIFDAERDGDGWYFFSEVGPADMITVAYAALEAALAASQAAGPNAANRIVTEHLAKLDASVPPSHNIDLDFTTTSWEFILQDIVRRSSTLKYVTAVSSFACSRMRADSFGGAVVVISAEKIVGKSTNDLLEEFIALVAP